MKIIGRAGREDIAMVYLAETRNGKYVEFVESLQPPIPREEKWVLIISSLFGCPIKCRICDCGGDYGGRLTREEILNQIDYLVIRRFPDRIVPVKKFKIQFARIGDPAFNDAVLDVLELLPDLYDGPGLIPCLSTIAPQGRGGFFDRLLEIKKRRYPIRFQLQFSIHSTDDKLRDWLIPTKKWSFEKIDQYGRAFFDNGGKKITLNFAVSDGMPVDANVLLRHFDPEIFFIKITPINPTYQAIKHELATDLNVDYLDQIIGRVRAAGYDTLLSIGELEENKIGSNCGQYVLAHKRSRTKIRYAYTYDLKRL